MLFYNIFLKFPVCYSYWPGQVSLHSPHAAVLDVSVSHVISFSLAHFTENGGSRCKCWYLLTRLHSAMTQTSTVRVFISSINTSYQIIWTQYANSRNMMCDKSSCHLNLKPQTTKLLLPPPVNMCVLCSVLSQGWLYTSLYLYVDVQNVGARGRPTHKVSVEAFIFRFLWLNMILE